MEEDEILKNLNILNKKSFKSICYIMDMNNLWPPVLPVCDCNSTKEQYEVDLKNFYCNYLSKKIRFNTR